MSEELIERLKGIVAESDPNDWFDVGTIREAAAQLEALTKERDEALALAEGPESLRDLVAAFHDRGLAIVGFEAQVAALGKERDLYLSEAQLWGAECNTLAAQVAVLWKALEEIRHIGTTVNHISRSAQIAGAALTKFTVAAPTIDELASQITTENRRGEFFAENAKNSAEESAVYPVPAGWVLVPIEPTEAILDAFWEQSGESFIMRTRTHERGRHYWRRMISAAPAEARSAQPVNADAPTPRTDGRQPPAGYVKLPAGECCKCIGLWQQASGELWCCKGAAIDHD